MTRSMEEKLSEFNCARKILDNARKILGYDLAGHSVVDLLCDNRTDWSLEKCTNLAQALKIQDDAKDEALDTVLQCGPKMVEIQIAGSNLSPERQAWLEIDEYWAQLSHGLIDRFEFNLKWAEFMHRKDVLRQRRSNQP